MKNYKKDFPIFSQTINTNPLCYLDSASTAQKPQMVLDAINSFYTTCNANIFRGIHVFGEQATTLYEDARKKVAQFINARSSSEIIFTRGCTEGINFIAIAWARATLKSGDEIVLTQLEHHANFLPWQQLVKTNGVVLRVIPVHKDGTLNMQVAQKLITNKTKLVTMLDVSNAIGTHVDVKTLASYARTVGAKVLIDAAQSVAHQKTDVQKLNPDFLVFSGHKLGAPTGVGVLYIKQELHDAVEPYQFGGGMVFEVGDTHSKWLPSPQKFEAGTPSIAQAIGLGAAIDYFNTQVDFNTLQKHEAQLCARLIDGLQDINNIRILGPIEQLKVNGHVVSFVMNNVHAHDIAAYLSNFGMCIRAGHHCAQPLASALSYDASARVSFYLYNTDKDVDAVLERLCEL